MNEQDEFAGRDGVVKIPLPVEKLPDAGELIVGYLTPSIGFGCENKRMIVLVAGGHDALKKGRAEDRIAGADGSPGFRFTTIHFVPPSAV